MHQFFEAANEHTEGEEKLTFSAGMVLANHKVPIRDTVRLATRLMNSAKQSYLEQSQANLLAWHILESFDHLGEEFERFRAVTRPPMFTERDSIITDQALTLLLEARRRLSPGGQSVFPATRRHAIGAALHRGDLREMKRHFDRLFAVAGLKESDRSSLVGLPEKWHNATTLHTDQSMQTRDSHAVWMHLFELWDYLPTAEVTHA